MCEFELGSQAWPGACLAPFLLLRPEKEIKRRLSDPPKTVRISLLPPSPTATASSDAELGGGGECGLFLVQKRRFLAISSSDCEFPCAAYSSTPSRKSLSS